MKVMGSCKLTNQTTQENNKIENDIFEILVLEESRFN
jgi:hypothetical protein